MESTFSEQISREKRPIFFISPHLDDAILSCGGLISDLAKQSRVTVLTVFTDAHSEPSTFSARRFLQKCNEKDAPLLFAKRRQEDDTVMKKANVSLRHLGYVDGTWRKYHHPSRYRKALGRFIPEFVHIYPTFLHVSLGRLHKEDTQTIAQLRNDLEKILPKNAVVFAPLAIGNHIDHVLVREALSALPKVTYWSDFPYSLKSSVPIRFITEKKLTEQHYTPDSARKEELIKGYISQLPSLFPDGVIPQKDEVYYSAS